MSPRFLLGNRRRLLATTWQDQPPASSSFLLTLPFPGPSGPPWEGLPLRTFWPTPSPLTLPDPATPSPVSSLQAADVRFHPPQDVFLLRVERALQAVTSGRLSKVVVARAVEVILTRRPRPPELLTLLWQHKTPEETAFLIAHPQGIFLGLTPETLFRMEGRNIQVDLLAGTARDPRGLHASHLEEEHALVGEGVKTALGDLLVRHTIEDLPPRPAGPVWHRWARLTGELREGVSWETVLWRLHPTPALGGHPREAALRWIQEEERGIRGLYGGVVGWVENNRSAFYVAIRSGLLRGNHLFLFAGGGVVGGHTPEELWEETTLKMQRLAAILLAGSPPF